MIIAYIKMYIRLGLGNLTVLELNQLQKEIDGMIQNRCDQLLAETTYDLVLPDEVVEREIEYYESCRSN